MMRIGVANGRGLEKCIALLNDKQAFKTLISENKLYYKNESQTLEIVIVRGADLVYASKNNYIDVAIGSQLLFAEDILKSMRFMGNLQISTCRLSLIGQQHTQLNEVKIIGTRYPKVTVRKLNSLKLYPELIELSGCLESWLLNGSCDAIVDVIDTGKTLLTYNLKEMVRFGPVEHGIWVNENINQHDLFIDEIITRSKNFQFEINT